MHRYPGIRPFLAEDQPLFHGREQEKRELFRLIVLNDLVVLFGKSGAGKTSLLRAGVSPALENRHLHCVFIRLNNPSQPPEAQVYQQLLESSYLPEGTPPGKTLWEYFKLFWHTDAGEIQHPVLVFDQFEELFTLYSPEERAVFVQQWASVVNGLLPDELRQRVLEQDEDWAKPPVVKFALSIRSDFLYLLDDLSSAIPSVLSARFQLKPFDKAAAQQAILAPAALEGEFDTPVFSFHSTALQEITEALSVEKPGLVQTQKQRDDGEIEAFQVQLLCRHIEQKIKHEGREKGFVVLPDFYGGVEGIRLILSQFYEDILRKLPTETHLKVQKMLGKELVRNERRIMMEESALLEESGLTAHILHVLEDERLLKKETRSGGFYYEISHDTLLEPILEKYRAIEAKELAEKQEQERLVRELELAEERRKRRKARRLAAIMSALALAALLGLAIARWQYLRLQEANRLNLQMAFDAQVLAATTLKVEGKYDLALQTLGDAAKTAAVLAAAEQRRVDELMQKWVQVKTRMATGDSLARLQSYRLAGQQYLAADSISPDDQIKRQAAQNQAQLEKRFNDLKLAGEKFENAKDWQMARTRYQQALALKPADPTILQKLEKLEK